MQPRAKRRFPLVVIAGPSGAGKDTLVKAALVRYSGKLLHGQLTTTRLPRGGEENHRFVSCERFERHEADGEFVEHAYFFGDWYGRLWSDLNDDACVITQEVIGFNNLVPLGKLTTIFVAPPSLEVLRERLRARGTNSEASLLVRLTSAEKELRTAASYDHTIVNGDIVASLQRLFTILDPIVGVRY
jgi:guanylate kinase